ncbi:MAG: sulfite oxidase-like oxidoreductase [Acidimicrobiia bacterium]|nr:sulfite oxidase-like oxidoreductase [Acidimicrobiia bacterium]
MSFFKRNREQLIAQGIDPARLPPGQYVTERFPVLQAGVIPKIDFDSWDFTIGGLVAAPVRWTFDEFMSVGSGEMTADIHCVTKWSKFDTNWSGVPVSAVWEQLDVDPSATHVLLKAEHGFTANLPIEDFVRDGNLFANRFDGADLELEHGWPLRLVVPHLYFWKSVKWVRGFDVLAHDEPGFWERNGYHMYGDPFKEQRFWGD